MKIIPATTIKQNQYRNNFKATIYEDNKIIEKDILSMDAEKNLFKNPKSPDKNIIGVKLKRETNKINMYSRFNNLIGIFDANTSKPQPQINLQIGNFQPVVELKDAELGITVLLTRGASLIGDNIDLRIKPLRTTNPISFGHNLVITTGYKSEKIKQTVENYQNQNKHNDIKVNSYYINKLKNDYTILGLGGGYGTRLKPISDLSGDNKPSTPYPGNYKTLFDVAVMDTATKAGKIDSIKYINDDETNLTGTAGIIIKALKNGTVNPKNPLVLLTGDTLNNIDLAKALYDYEQSPDCGIAMVVNQIKSLHDKSCIKFNYNSIENSYVINTMSNIVNDNNINFIKDTYYNKVTNDKNYYTSTNIMIISPKILSYLKKFADANGNADYMNFFGLMYNVLNKRDENLFNKYPNGIPSAELSLHDLTYYDGKPQAIFSPTGDELKVKAIIAKDINGNDAISEDVGTIENYLQTIKNINTYKNKSFGDKFLTTLSNNIDENGVLYYGQNAKLRFEKFKEKYGIKKIIGNAIVHASSTNNSSSQKIDKKPFIINQQKNINELNKLTQDETSAQNFINTLMKNPEHLQEKSQSMIKEYGVAAFLNWYLSPNGYYGNYEKYVDNFYKNAKSIEDLLKFSPAWAPWKLEEKAWRLNYSTYYNANNIITKKQFDDYNDTKREYGFEIGTFPKDFDFKSSFINLVQMIKTNDITKEYFGKFIIKRLKGGELNDKFIYSIEIHDGSGKKYILKFDRTNVEDANTINGRELSLYEKKIIRKNKYLAADSIYSNACISKYLELNGCKNIPILHYYNQNENVAIYEYIADKQNDLFQNNLIDEEYESLITTNSLYKNLNKLGIYLNDTALKNILTTSDGVAKIIDLGHANFIMPFKPGVKHYNIEFANTNGPDMRAILASILEI